MGRKKTEFPKHGVQMSDFKWTKDMAKKDRNVAKQYIDWLLSDIEKRDRWIKDLWEQLKEVNKLRARDIELMWLEKRKITGLYNRQKQANDALIITTAICLVCTLVMWVLYFI